MPLFTNNSTRDMYFKDGWDTMLYDQAPTNNYSTNTSLSCGAAIGRGGTHLYRVIISCDLSGLENQTIQSSTLTMKTTSGFGVGTAEETRVYKVTGTNPVIQSQVCWNGRSGPTDWLSSGGDFDQLNYSVANWPALGGVSFTTNDLSSLLEGEEGNVVYLLIKAFDETTHTGTKSIYGSNESMDTGNGEPYFTITTTQDHIYVYTKGELTKFMNKKNGIKARSSVPSM